MATDKTFSVVGVSTLNGETKVRFANDVLRIKVLAKNGHTNINLIELAEPMLKLDAAKFIKPLPEFAEGDAQFAIDEFIEKNSPKPVKEKVEKPAVEKQPKQKKAKADKTEKSTPAPVPTEQHDMGTVVAQAIDEAVAEVADTPEDDENQPF